MEVDHSADGTEVPASLQSPLAAAVAQRDAGVLETVFEALKAKQTVLAFQPIMKSRSPERPAFWEGLIRIRDASGRTIPAADFMTQVEDTELGRRIDCASLELGLSALAAEPTLRLSINMSARSIGYRRWQRILERGLRRDKSAGERLILEITETSAMMMPEVVQEFMFEQKMNGVTFALDDFGAGYTCFRYLRDFDFDILKIDGSYIANIAGNADNQALVKSMVALARYMEMFTVASRVETDADAQWLTRNGLDCLQGFYFAAPTLRPWWQNGGQVLSA